MSSKTNKTVTAILSKEAKTGLSITQISKHLNDALDVVHFDSIDDVDLPVETFRDSLLYRKIFEKYNDPDPQAAEMRSAAAWKKFHDGEATCLITNIRFSKKCYVGTKYADILEILRKEIARVLGPFDPDFFFDGTFGPGGNTCCRRPYVDAAFKFDMPLPSCTQRFLPFARLLAPWVSEQEIVVNDVATATQADKNAKENRLILTQGRLMALAQSGLGKAMRRGMNGQPTGYRDYTINLDLQTVNQELTYWASLERELATVDLSNASNLIAYLFVMDVIPYTWFHAMDLCRMPKLAMPDGSVKTLQMLGNMGNSYIWEFQSVLFYCMVRSVAIYYGHPVIAATFGDDIICHVDCIDDLDDFFTYCGLKLNLKKSHWRGSYRESCGKHYYKGQDVTPVYIKRPFIEEFDLVLAHNRLFHWATSRGFKDSRLKGLLEMLRGRSMYRKIRVPVTMGDCGFHTCRNDLSYIPTFHITHEWIENGYAFKRIIISRSLVKWEGPGSYLKRLAGWEFGEDTEHDIPLGNLYCELGWANSKEWPALGCWL